MPSKPDSSFAYRASQFILKNRSLVFCNCIKPFVEYSARRGKNGGIRYCYVCKGLIDDKRAEDIEELAKELEKRG